MDELAAEMKGGDLNYDVVIASPDAMRVVGQLGQILGPRGLMPNPKVGTVTPDVATAVKNAKLVRYVSVPTRTASSTAPSVRSISSRPSCSRTLKRCWLT